MIGKLLLSILALATDGSAQPSAADAPKTPKYHVGSDVIVIHETPLRVDDYPVKQLEAGTPLRVEQLSDEGFLGVTSGRSGWVDATDVVSADQALEPLSKLIAEDADNIRLHQAAGRHCHSQKELGPGHRRSHHAHAAGTRRHEVLSAPWRSLDQKTRNRKSPGRFRRSNSARRKSRLSLLKRGFLRAQQKDYEKSLADFNEALSHDPDDSMRAEILAYRGSIYMDQREVEKAFVDFNESLRLNPRDSANFVMRGSATTARQIQRSHRRLLRRPVDRS